jgi:hypothetical protein
MVLHPNLTNKLVRTHSAPFWCWDKPWATLDSLDSPRPELEGSHHLPPYSILCSCPLHLHPNGSFSWDSQSGVPKLSQFRLSGLWTLITPCPKLGSGQGLNQSCSSSWELSKDVSHFTCTHRNRVNSRLLVVGSQTAKIQVPNYMIKYANGIMISRVGYHYQPTLWDALKACACPRKLTLLASFFGVKISFHPKVGVWFWFGLTQEVPFVLCQTWQPYLHLYIILVIQTFGSP